MTAIKTKLKPLILTSVITMVIGVGDINAQEKKFLSKIFKGKKAKAAEQVSAEEISEAATETGNSQNALLSVDSKGKIVGQAAGTETPKRITPAKPASSGIYAPVASSALAVSALDKPSPLAAEAAIPTGNVSEAALRGQKSNSAYKPVSSTGAVVASRKAGPPAPIGATKTKKAAPGMLPPMPSLYDPKTGAYTKSADAPAVPAALGDEASKPVIGNLPTLKEGTTLPSLPTEPSVMSEPAVAQTGAYASASAVQSSPEEAEIQQIMTGKKSEYVAEVNPAHKIEDNSSTMQRFPAIDLPETRKSIAEQNVDWLIDQVATAYSESLAAINGDHVGGDGSLPSVPSDFGAAWGKEVRNRVWSKSGSVNKSLKGIYSSALTNSHQIKSFSSIPLIRETGIQEAQGAFDWTAFLEGRYSHTDEPTSSILTTGETGRFRQDLWEGEYGIRKRLKTGAEVSVSNRLSTLDNNSQFLDPNPQTGSELVVSITQPLLQGAGYDYNTTAIKIAKLDAKLGAAEYLRQLEEYLLEVNRTYWGVYLARAGYLQRKSLVARTKALVGELEDRKGVDAEATASELLRARSSLAQRKASLIRSEMSIKLAEERLRALVNDPSFALGSTNELVPTTAPILSAPNEDVREVAKSAIQNRPELLQGFYQVQAAGLRRDLQKNELQPTLNLILEGTVAGLGADRDLNRAYNNMFEAGEGWLAGFTLEMPLERNFAKARFERRRQELRQQLNELRGTVDSVALEAIVAYRELQTAYRDMQAKYSAAVATREELKELEQRLDVDAGGKGGTVGYQLQLTLDAIERNQQQEEAFLVSVVVYNTAFTTLDKARGTLLRRHDVQIVRETEDGLDTINSYIGGDAKGVAAGAGSK